MTEGALVIIEKGKRGKFQWGEKESGEGRRKEGTRERGRKRKEEEWQERRKKGLVAVVCGVIFNFQKIFQKILNFKNTPKYILKAP